MNMQLKHSALARHMAARRAWQPVLGAVLILALWLVLFKSLFPFLSVILAREDFRTNQLLLLAIFGLIARRAWSAWRARVPEAGLILPWPAPRPVPLALLGVGVLGFLIERRFFDVNMLGATLFALASYGLLGLWLAPRDWRAGLPAALMLTALLPFGDFLQTFIGYPMRIATAEIIRATLQHAGIASLGVDTILVFENGVSHIDLPCSGVKSLWTGAVFYLAATWLERKPLNGRWLLGAALFTAALFLTNLLRVSALIVSGEVLGWRLLAELMHVPLGVAGFVAACGVALLWLRRAPSSTGAPPVVDSAAQPSTAGAWRTAASVAIALLVANAAYMPRAWAVSAAHAPVGPLTYPNGLHVAPVELRQGELDWLYRDGAESVERIRFEWRGDARSATSSVTGSVTGSLILVQSSTWRAHHKPERCFENYGLRAEHEQTLLIDAGHPARFVRLAQNAGGHKHSALYWFQSADHITDDYGARLWSAFTLTPPRWVLVSVLFDNAHDENQPELHSLARALRAVVQQRLQEPS